MKSAQTPVATCPCPYTRSSAIAEGPRDASCQLKSCQLPRNRAKTTCTTSPEQIEVMMLAYVFKRTPKQSVRLAGSRIKPVSEFPVLGSQVMAGES